MAASEAGGAALERAEAYLVSGRVAGAEGRPGAAAAHAESRRHLRLPRPSARTGRAGGQPGPHEGRTRPEATATVPSSRSRSPVAIPTAYTADAAAPTSSSESASSGRVVGPVTATGGRQVRRPGCGEHAPGQRRQRPGRPARGVVRASPGASDHDVGGAVVAASRSLSCSRQSSTSIARPVADATRAPEASRFRPSSAHRRRAAANPASSCVVAIPATSMYPDRATVRQAHVDAPNLIPPCETTARAAATSGHTS